MFGMGGRRGSGCFRAVREERRCRRRRGIMVRIKVGFGRCTRVRGRDGRVLGRGFRGRRGGGEVASFGFRIGEEGMRGEGIY